MAPIRAEQLAAKRVRIRKYMGDDAYSWALFVDGRPVFTGLGQVEAQAQRRRAIRNLAAGLNWTGGSIVYTS